MMKTQWVLTSCVLVQPSGSLRVPCRHGEEGIERKARPTRKKVSAGAEIIDALRRERGLVG